MEFAMVMRFVFCVLCVIKFVLECFMYKRGANVVRRGIYSVVERCLDIAYEIGTNTFFAEAVFDSMDSKFMARAKNRRS